MSSKKQNQPKSALLDSSRASGKRRERQQEENDQNDQSNNEEQVMKQESIKDELGGDDFVSPSGKIKLPENKNSKEYTKILSKMFDNLKDYIKMMDNLERGSSSNPEDVAEGVWCIRCLLCHPDRSPIQGLAQNQGIKKLIDLLDAPDPNIRYNAGFCVTNISSSAQSYASLIISQGAIPKFIGSLQSPYEKLREQSAWCLGNMAGDGQRI
jgi:Armadillo/beta-catenin-like repeat